jgi:hypothetical protein
MKVSPLHVHHAYWNAHAGPTRYLLVMTRRIADLIETLHAGPADCAEVLRAHEGELL